MQFEDNKAAGEFSRKLDQVSETSVPVLIKFDVSKGLKGILPQYLRKHGNPLKAELLGNLRKKPAFGFQTYNYVAITPEYHGDEPKYFFKMSIDEDKPITVNADEIISMEVSQDSLNESTEPLKAFIESFENEDNKNLMETIKEGYKETIGRFI